jgi:hypothetical protein
MFKANYAEALTYDRGPDQMVITKAKPFAGIGVLAPVHRAQAHLRPYRR